MMKKHRRKKSPKRGKPVAHAAAAVPARGGAASLALKSRDKNLILEALDELYDIRAVRAGGGGGVRVDEAVGEVEETAAGKKKPKPRKKARENVISKITAELKQDKKEDAKARKREERAREQPTGANVRIRIGNLVTSDLKLSLIKRSCTLDEVFKIAKAAFKSKKNKMKKPSRAFVKVGPTFEEVTRTDELCNDDVVFVSEGAVPDGFGGDGAAVIFEPGRQKMGESEAPSSRVEKLRAAYQRAFGPGSSSAGRRRQKHTRGNPEAETEYLQAKEIAAAANTAYQSMQAHRATLPAASFKREFLDVLSRHQVIVVSGETGCGKTTQIPQFILEDQMARGKGGHCSVVCTQPRRISAIGVAERVAAERGERVGDVVGYQIRLESRMSQHTRIEFCTMGIFLRRLVSDPLLKEVSHIIVDEVHERETLSDFSLVILRDLLSQRPELKVVLMSATLNAGLFSSYFHGCPTMHIPGRTFEVVTYGLEDIIRRLRYAPTPFHAKGVRPDARLKKLRRQGAGPSAEELALTAKQDQAIQEKMKTYPSDVLKTLERMDDTSVNYDLLEKLVVHICEDFGRGTDGAILIFLPGISEINQACKMLEKQLGSHAVVLPLHGSLTVAQQRRVFKSYAQGVRKIVVSTNIAETSITIDDVEYVIDSGRVKEIQYNETSQCQALVETYVSRANAKQRLGRAGRVRKGCCFQLFSFATWTKAMLPYQVPEIQRCSLEHVILQICLLQLGSPEDFLQKTLDPPRASLTATAVSRLQQIKALEANQDLTPLGLHLANLPVDAGIGKMLVFGALFECIEPVLTIAAGFSTKNPFLSPMNERDKAQAAKRGFSKHDSDLLTVVNAYNQWSAIGTYNEKRKFCRSNFLSQNTLEMMSHLRDQFRRLLVGAGFLRPRVKEDSEEEDEGMTLWDHGVGMDLPCNRNGTSVAVLRAVLVAGLYPNVVRVQKSDTKASRYGYEFFSNNESVSIHPGSINYRLPFGKKRWLVYHQKQRTSQMFVYDSSVVSPRALLLFGGPMTYDFDSTKISVGPDISFKTTPQTWKIMALLREEMEIVLEQRLDDPNNDAFRRTEERVMQIILRILETEDVRM